MWALRFWVMAETSDSVAARMECIAARCYVPVGNAVLIGVTLRPPITGPYGHPIGR
jgi:hypothetical protein